MRARLVSADGGPPIDLTKDLTLVGRDEDCDVRLEHKSISKIHCVIVKTDGLLFLRDLGSTNGTRVNGQRVRRAALLPNDELAIAGHRFRVWLGPDQTAEGRHGRTHQLDAIEVVNLLHKPEPAIPANDVPAPPAQPNALPDRYPESEAESS